MMMKKVLIVSFALLSVVTAVAEEITPEQAKRAVATWTSRASRKTFGEVRSVSPLTDETSGASFHVVKLDGGGYVVTASDNRVSPVVAYSDTDDFPTDPDNPLVQILKHDAMAIQQELEKASSRVVVKEARNALKASSLTASSAPSVAEDEFSAARNEWAELLGGEEADEQSSSSRARLSSAAAPKTTSVDSQIEVYVPAILKTKWGQTTHNGSSKGLPCYNYFTPLISDPKVRKADSEKSGDLLSGDILETNETTRVPCGCVATAAAQLMYKWTHPNGFNYAKMVHDTRWHSSETIRAAIGELTYSVAKKCNADWGTIAVGGTSMFTSEMVAKLRTSYGYASTTWVGSPSMKSSSGGLSEFNELVVPNLIANHPVILDITKGKGGHCVVADGLDMDGTTCRLHINLGWNGSHDSYYTPPSIQGYTSVRGIGINIMPHQSGAIIAGVIVDNDLVPLSQVKVTLGDSTKYSDSHGRYSFIVPSGTYTIVAEKDTLSNTAQATVKYSTGSDIKNAYVPIRLSAQNLIRTSAPVVTHTFDSSGQAIVTISADSGALITYTTDGTTPTDDFEESIPYNIPFTINGAGFRLIRARAFKEGFADSYTTDYRIPFPTSSSNGTFSSAKCITTSNGATLLNNISASRESGEPVHSVVGNVGGSSVWASFVAPDDADYTFTAKGSDSASGAKGSETDEESVLDTQLAVYTGDKLSNLSLVAANDDVDAAEFDFSSRVAFHAVKGRTYHIAVDTQYGEKGIVQLEWTEGREDVASPVDYDVFYDGEEQSRSIQIRSTADWFVVDCSDWIVLTKSSGADGESVVFTTPALANDTYRTGTILVQAGEGAYSTIRVTQSPAKWYTNKAEAFEAAEALGKRVLLVCGRDSCPNTTYVRLTACEDDTVKPILTSDYVLWYCDCDKQTSDYADYAFGLGSYTLPLVCIINPETPNKYVARRTNYATPAQLLEFLEENSEGLLPSLPIGTSASCSTNPPGVKVSWGRARRSQSYGIWRGDKWNPDSAVCIGETTSDTEFLDESAIPGVLYYYRVRAVNAVGAGAFSAVATGCYREISDTASAAIGNALGAPHLDWTTEGDYPWTVQWTNTYDGAGAMQSAFVNPTQSGVVSILKTTVAGATRMSFRYKTRMSTSQFVVKVDDVEAFLVTGSVDDWTLAEVEIPEGEHEVVFSYTKSGYYTSGFNGVYLDTVQFDVLSVQPTLTPVTTDDEDTALSFTGSMVVSIGGPEGSDIFYTIDGSNPTQLSPKYEGPFTISTSTLVKAMCVQRGWDVSATVSGLYLERHPIQAGEWTTNVEGAKKAALKDGSIIVTLLGNYETCGYTRSFAAVAESTEFLSWAKANGVYLITADSSRWIDTNASYRRFWDLFYDAGQNGSAYYPALAIANAWEPDTATGYAIARSGQSIGSVQYDGTVAKLEAGLTSFFATRPAVSFVWIEFDGNGGTPYERSKVGIVGEAIGDLPWGYRDNHYFDGWYTSAEGGEEITEKTVLRGDSRYYAHWIPYSYCVQFNANGGTVSTSYKYVSYGMTYGDLPIPTRTDTSYFYTFDGWYTAASGGIKITATTEVAITSTQTLYAHWTSTPLETYVITYDPGVNGTGARQTATKTQGVALTLKEAIFTRTGYAQTGWATADGGTKTFDLSSAYAVDSSATLYPFWTPNVYIVTLNRQSGTGGSANVSATYGSAMPAITVPTRTGYTFGGYFTSTGGGGTQYYTATGASARNWDKTAATTLYAKWTANTYAVTLDRQGGTGGSTSATATYGIAMPSITVPTQTGYTFGGYYTAVNGGGTQYYTASGASARNWDQTSATTLYAKWTETASTTQTVTFNANGGSCSISTKVYTIGSTYSQLPTASWTGHAFSGWWTSASGGTKITASTTVSSSTSRTFYAHWTADTYAVTLNRQSGSGGTLSVTATYGSAMPKITVPTRTGYTFGGYFTSTGGGGTQYYTASGASARSWDKTAATTLYAKWTANTYTVTLDQQGGTGGSTSATATYGSAMPSITVPTQTGYTFGGYYAAANGGGIQYYTATGASARNWDKTAATTLYAKWTLDSNRPSYLDPESSYWGVEFGTPEAPLSDEDYFTSNGLSGIETEDNGDGTHTYRVLGSADPEELQRAIDQADSGDTIWVRPGCYGPISVTRNNLTIISTDGRMSTFINGRYAAPCADLSGTTGTVLEGFTLVQGAGTNGGGIVGGTARDCLVAGCRASGNGGGAYNASLVDCVLDANVAAGSGGGAFGGTLNRCEVRGCVSGANGGGVASASATGCLLAGNRAPYGGGAHRAMLMSCTVADNVAGTSGGGTWGCTVRNSIVLDNKLASGAVANWAGASTFQYTCTTPVPKGTGNFNAAPRFVGQADGNYHLSNYSKCRDKGNKNLTKAPYDLAGLDRVMGSNIDVGCYEYATQVTPLDPADYDGDSLPDIGFYNPKTFTWFLRQTADGTVRREKLGLAGVTVVPRDYDGDGVRDPAIYNPNSGYWQILQSTTGEVAVKKLGWKGITLVDAADCDGDGCADPIICNASSKTWQVLRSSDGGTTVVKNFGWAGIKLACGDYDGDGVAELAFYSSTSCTWYIRWWDGTQTSLKLGVSGARVFPLDADFDGALDPCYFDPATGKWTWKSLSTGEGETVKFGDSTVTPHPFDWDGDGMPDTFGFYSPYRAGFLDLYLESDGTRRAYMTNF